MLHSKCEHGFNVHRIVTITALSLHALHQLPVINEMEQNTDRTYQTIPKGYALLSDAVCSFTDLILSTESVS